MGPDAPGGEGAVVVFLQALGDMQGMAERLARFYRRAGVEQGLAARRFQLHHLALEQLRRGQVRKGPAGADQAFGDL